MFRPRGNAESKKDGRATAAAASRVAAVRQPQRAAGPRAAIWLNDGTLGDHLDDVRALHEAFGLMAADLLVLALHAAGRSDEARRARTSPNPIRPDFFFTFLTSLRAMAVVALNDRDAAEKIYADLLPHRDGPPAGAESISLAVRPVAHTLGELALLLGRADEAAAHFAQAAAIADQWNSPHWSADARTRADLALERAGHPRSTCHRS